MSKASKYQRQEQAQLLLSHARSLGSSYMFGWDSNSCHIAFLDTGRQEQLVVFV